MSQSISKNSEAVHEAPALDSHGVSAALAGADGSLRVDGPHLSRAVGQSPIPGGVLDPNPFSKGIDLTQEIPKSVADFAASHRRDEEDTDFHGEKSLLQANQIAEHFQKKTVDLDRREQRLNSQLALLDQERRNVRLWVGQFDLQVQDRESALQYREAACAEREAAVQLAEKELQNLRLQLRFNDEESIAAREAAILQGEQDLEEQRLELECRREDFVAERQRQLDEIAAERAEKLSELDRREAEIEQSEGSLGLLRGQQEAELHEERGLLDSRLRFQQEHLQKTRRDLEAAQQQFHLERQSQRAKFEQDATGLQLRRKQISRFREILDEREQSLLREEGFLAESRVHAQEIVDRDKIRLQEERRSWERERELQWTELHRQQEMLATHAENLDSRRARLDQLRAELEDSHCAILEMRAAIEEVCVQFSQAVGPEVARANIEAAREDLVNFYQQTHQGLIQQRQELEQMQLQLHSQREAFQNERGVLTAWVEERDEQLRARTLEMQKEQEMFEVREQTWIATRDNWKLEKLHAESIIRDLLQKLADQPATPPTPFMDDG